MDTPKNKGGRPQGSGNKLNTQIKDTIRAAVRGEAQYLADVLAEMRELDPVTWLSMLHKYGTLVLPKPVEEPDPDNAADFDVDPAVEYVPDPA